MMKVSFMLKILTSIKVMLVGIVAQALLFPTVIHANNIDINTKVPGVLSVISYSKFTPVSYSTHGEGYEGDLLRAVAKLWGLEIKFYPESIYEGLWLLPSRDYTIADISMGGMSPSGYRIQQGALFSIGTVSFNQSLLVRKTDYQSGRIVSYQSFKKNNRKIGVVPGTTGELYAHLRAKENNLPCNIFVEYESESELLPALMNGKIDAIARGDIGNRYQESQNNKLITIAKKSFGETFAFAVNNTNQRLSNNLNQAIRQITNNGKITYSQWIKNHNVFLEQVHRLA